MSGLLSVLVVALCLFAVACSTEGTGNGATSASDSNDSLDVAAEVFKGNPTRVEIQSQMTRALTLYGLPVTDENYSRSASALVALRKTAEEDGYDDITEMDILSHTIRSHVPGLNIKLPEQMGLSLVFLIAGDE